MTGGLILASQSAARIDMLRAAGVPFEAEAARVDEAAVKAALVAEGAPPRDVADALAELKARKVAMRHPDRLVLGADQVLALGQETLDKPRTLEEAGEHLRRLRGRSHQLLSAAVICEEGRPVWRQVGCARLTMRPFSDAFLDDYLQREGDALLEVVGAYRLEALGSQLFSRVEGDYFSILGLPLLELLAYLRVRGFCLE
jgi:septum formation protein